MRAGRAPAPVQRARTRAASDRGGACPAAAAGGRQVPPVLPGWDRPKVWNDASRLPPRPLCKRTVIASRPCGMATQGPAARSLPPLGCRAAALLATTETARAEGGWHEYGGAVRSRRANGLALAAWQSRSGKGELAALHATPQASPLRSLPCRCAPCDDGRSEPVEAYGRRRRRGSASSAPAPHRCAQFLRNGVGPARWTMSVNVGKAVLTNIPLMVVLLDGAYSSPPHSFPGPPSRATRTPGLVGRRRAARTGVPASGQPHGHCLGHGRHLD
jgi:hypothetical protein